MTLSTWLAEAAADRLRLMAHCELVEEWEAEHGVITATELDALDRKVAEARRQAAARTAGQRGAPRRRRAAS